MDNDTDAEISAPNFREKLFLELCEDGREKDLEHVWNLAISKFLEHFDKSEHEEALKEIRRKGDIFNLLFVKYALAEALEEYANSINYVTKKKIHPVKKETKSIRVIEQTSHSYSCGFDLTFEELADYYTQKCGWETSKIKVMQKNHKEKGCDKFQVLGVVERRYQGDGGWYLLLGNINECTLRVDGLSATGEILSIEVNVLDFKSLFNFFGLEYLHTVFAIVDSAKNAFKAADKATISEMGENKYVTTEVVISELSYEGKQVIKAAKRQSEYFMNQLNPENGKYKINIWEAGDDHSENVLAIKVISELTPHQRRLIYCGTEGITESDIESIFDKNDSLPMITKELLKEVRKAKDDIDAPLACRTFYVPRKYAEMHLKGDFIGAELLNAFGDSILYFCEQFRCKLA